jgi:hypothetical protein
MTRTKEMRKAIEESRTSPHSGAYLTPKEADAALEILEQIEVLLDLGFIAEGPFCYDVLL